MTVAMAKTAAFAATDLPSRKLDAWKYTDLRALAALAPVPAPAIAETAALAADLPPLAGPRLVFINGRRAASLSVSPPVSVSDECARETGRAHPEPAPLAALNARFAALGAAIHVPAGVDAGTLALVHLTLAEDATPVFVHPRHRITLAAGATLTVIEYATGHGVYWHNPVFEITLAPGATLRHVRLQAEDHESFHTATLFVDLLAGARYDAFTLGVGARLARSETHARLGGTGAHAALSGVQLLRGNQHGDITSVVAHDAPGCTSRQTVKNVLDGRARAVFQGRIEVARAAQKTDGYQMSQALLLSPEAEIDCKPELEIFADDVKCSHGATIGALDPEQLFYLRARGIPEATARAMLVRAFLDEAIEGVADGAARALLESAIGGWWEGAQ